jgi:hypothetical protein
VSGWFGRPYSFDWHLRFLVARAYYNRYRPWMARHRVPRSFPPDLLVYRVFYAYYFKQLWRLSERLRR